MYPAAPALFFQKLPSPTPASAPTPELEPESAPGLHRC